MSSVPYQALARRLQYERALAATSRILLVGREADPLPKAMQELLDAAAAGRVYIFQCFDHRRWGVCLRLTHEVCGAGVRADRDDPRLQRLPLSGFLQRWFAEFRAGRYIAGRVCDLPPDERAELEPYGMRAILIIPLLLGGEVQGFVGFDDLGEDGLWDEDDIRLLQTGAELIGAYLEREQAQAHINQLAFYDSLTRLPNRRLLLDRLQHALANSARRGDHGAVLFIDLDNFKQLNDSKGHAVGDRLLLRIAQRLRRVLRETDTVARPGGDEFVVILENLSGEPARAATEAEVVADKLRAVIERPCALDGERHQSSSSIGVALFCGHEQSVDELLKRADSAMYLAKAAGRNTVRFFDPAMQARLEARAALAAELRQALQRQQFELYYQPQVDTRGRLCGAEVLLRWRHPKRGLVAPGEFIPLAEETGSILEIGDWVLREACERLRQWAERPRARELQLAVNVSARQFRDPRFVARVRDALGDSGAAPARLKLELTESVVLDNVEATVAKMRELKALGLAFSMDDFGTGYSSLTYLKRLPLDQLKIDRSFVRDVVSDPSDAALVQAIIGMARNLGLEPLAEGVELPAQLELLRGWGCRAFQGYLFGRPLPLAEFECLLTADG